MEKRKEKSELEKLIELLNEYEMNVVMKSYMHPVYYYDEDKNKILNLYIGFNTEDEVKYQWLLSYIVSNSYGFIKWLVENDKIEFSKVKEKIGLDRELYDRMLYWYKEEDFLIMILSIENEPIRFLCSILK